MSDTVGFVLHVLIYSFSTGTTHSRLQCTRVQVQCWENLTCGLPILNPTHSLLLRKLNTEKAVPQKSSHQPPNLTLLIFCSINLQKKN